MENNLGDKLQTFDLLPVANVTATANGTGIDLSSIQGEIAVVADIANASAGTNPTLDLTIEESDVLGSGYTAVSGGAFTQVTGSGGGKQKISLNKSELKKYLRIVKTIGGTDNPAFLASVVAVGIKKYP